MDVVLILFKDNHRCWWKYIWWTRADIFTDANMIWRLIARLSHICRISFSHYDISLLFPLDVTNIDAQGSLLMTLWQDEHTCLRDLLSSLFKCNVTYISVFIAVIPVCTWQICKYQVQSHFCNPTRHVLIWKTLGIKHSLASTIESIVFSPLCWTQSAD